MLFTSWPPQTDFHASSGSPVGIRIRGMSDSLTDRTEKKLVTAPQLNVNIPVAGCHKPLKLF